MKEETCENRRCARIGDGLSPTGRDTGDMQKFVQQVLLLYRKKKKLDKCEMMIGLALIHEQERQPLRYSCIYNDANNMNKVNNMKRNVLCNTSTRKQFSSC